MSASEGTPTILVAEKLGAGGVEMLKQAGNVDCSYSMTKEDLLAKIRCPGVATWVGSART